MSDCDNYKSQLELFSLDPESVADSNSLRTHLDNCEGCRADLAAIHDTWASLPLALDPMVPSADLISRVMAAPETTDVTLEHSPANGVERLEKNQAPARVDFLKYVLAASVLIGLLSGYTVFLRTSQTPRRPDAVAPPNTAERQHDEFDESKVHYVSLVRLDSQTPVATHVLCDLTSRQIHFVLFELTDFLSTDTYKIWLLGESNQVFSSSALAVNDDKIGKALMSLPASLGDVTQVVVTRESDSGASSPSDQVLLGGPADGRAWESSNK